MKTIIITALFACLLAASFGALARYGDDAPKGWLLVRSGTTNADANYDKEDKDANDKLHGVSVVLDTGWVVMISLYTAWSVSSLNMRSVTHWGMDVRLLS